MASVQGISARMYEQLFGKAEEEVPRSPEAKLGLKVEDLWDVQEPQLSPTEKLNSCFENVLLSDFPPAPSSQVIELKSDASLADAVQILSEHRILSAPVVDVDAPQDATWIDRYIGIVEFAGIVMWILQQSEPPSPRSPMRGTAVGLAASKVTSAGGSEDLSAESAAATPGSFFEALISSELYRNTKVHEISGTFRWAPFLALQKSDTFLTMLILLSKYKMKSIPVVDLGEGRIDNVITQSAVIHMLAECAGLHWFESWGTKTLYELGLPLMASDRIIQVHEDEPVLQAFKLLRRHRIGGLPVVENGSGRATGDISLRDIQVLLTAPQIYHDYRSITVKDFLTAARDYSDKHEAASPSLSGMLTCKKDQTIKELIFLLDSKKIHRAYLVDENGHLEGVITLRDIISKLVHEPRGYFGDFFDGVLPPPLTSRV